jgi:hypothetical protein
VFRVATTLRGGTLQFLHITEFAKICQENPTKANEIISGALNAVQAGQFVCIESTARGRDGHFFKLCKSAQAQIDSNTPLGVLDWKLWFFSWWQHPDYVLDSKNVLISKDMSEYFDALQSKDIFLTPEQKAWYIKKMQTQGEYMKREYPSTPEEAFETANEGYYFAKQISVARQERRICHLPYDENAKTYTAWDIGIGDSCAIWVFQLVGKEVHCIDYYENSDEALAHYVKWLKTKPYIFEKHFLPHDAAAREKGTGKSFADIARGLGLKIDILPRDTNEMFGIECLRSMLPRFFFDQSKCEKGVKAVESFRKEWNEKLGCYRDKSYHDWCLEGSTKIRTLNGWKSISEVKKGDYVWGYSSQEKRLVPSLVTKSGKTGENRELMEVGLDSGKYIKCTPNHRFMLFTGEWKEAKDLVPEDSLMPFYEVLNRKYIEIDLNDGSFCDEHRFVWSRFNGSVPKHFHIDHRDNDHFNNDPSNLQMLKKDDHCQKTFEGKNNEQRKLTDRTDYNREFYQRKDVYQKCKSCFEEYFGSYKTCYCSEKCRNDFRKVRDASGLVRSRTKEYKKISYERRKNHRVRYVKKCDNADVYDLEVPATDSFVAEGIVVHNSSHGSKALIYCAESVQRTGSGAGMSAEEWARMRKEWL